MNKVWRVQNEQGYGPYRGPGMDYAPWNDRSWWHHPVPTKDLAFTNRFGIRWPSLRLPKTFVFGFASADQYAQWFNKVEWRQFLRDQGYHLYQYLSSDVTVGEHQILFDLAKSNIIGRSGCLDFEHIASKWEFR